MQIERSEEFKCRGDADFSSAKSVTFKNDMLPRTGIAEEALVEVAIPFSACRVWDDHDSLPPTTPADDDLGIIVGTWGTDSPLLRTENKGSNGLEENVYTFFEVEIPNNYILGNDLQLSFYAGMDTAVADQSAYIDLEVYVGDREGSVGSDLCSTAQQDVNSLTADEFDFAITTTGLVRGDVLLCRLALKIDDNATGTVYGAVYHMKTKYDLRG